MKEKLALIRVYYTFCRWMLYPSAIHKYPLASVSVASSNPKHLQTSVSVTFREPEHQQQPQMQMFCGAIQMLCGFPKSQTENRIFKGLWPLEESRCTGITSVTSEFAQYIRDILLYLSATHKHRNHLFPRPSADPKHPQTSVSVTIRGPEHPVLSVSAYLWATEHLDHLYRAMYICIKL